MGRRGRKAESAVTRIERPEPPDSLREHEREVWERVVASLPADWFDEQTRPLLVQFCRHAVRAEGIAEQIGRIGPRMELLREEREQTRMMMSLATKMRITPQSTRTHRGNARPGLNGTRPWDDAEQAHDA